MDKIELQKREAAILTIAAVIACLAIFNLQIATESINSITGAALTTVNISPLPPVPCNFTVESGWNLVSFYCISLLESRQYVTDNITSLGYIFEYEESNPTDPWKSYNPSLDSVYVQDLDTMSRAKGYWLYMNSSENILVYGGLRLPTSINVVPGWNLVGYPTNETKGTFESFSSIYPNYTEVRGYNWTTKTFQNFIPPSSGGLRNTTPYNGYWVNMTASGVWVVD